MEGEFRWGLGKIIVPLGGVCSPNTKREPDYAITTIKQKNAQAHTIDDLGRAKLGPPHFLI